MFENKVKPFPCIFGVAGFGFDQLRYCFSEDMAAADIAPALEHYVDSSRNYGANTSLVVFSKPGPVKDMLSYERQFWSLLAELTLLDKSPWPSEIPAKIDAPLWEFCFASESIFVVCNTPAHVTKQSRHMSSLTLTFQPRWVFEKIMADPRMAQKSSQSVRSRLSSYDLSPISPYLGFYGDPQNREYAQYFLRDDNSKTQCPFHHWKPVNGVSKRDVRVSHTGLDPNNLWAIINQCLPEQGAIEVQHDREGKEHPWHTHNTDETIVVLEGKLRFYWETGKEICQVGDVIELPKGVKHGSIAIGGDAKYIIGFERINLL